MDTSLIPEKINDFNVYLSGDKMIGHGEEMTLPTIEELTSTISGAGLGGKIDSPTPGKFKSIEQELTFNLIQSSAKLINSQKAVDLTFRAAQQMFDSADGGGYQYVGLRIVERGRLKKREFGKLKIGESQEVKMTLELTYFMVESDGETVLEIDKLNGTFIEHGVDMMAAIKALI